MNSVQKQITPTEGCVAVLSGFLLGALLITVGWNYGITELVAAAGGTLGHINILDAALSLIALRVVQGNRVEL